MLKKIVLLFLLPTLLFSFDQILTIALTSQSSISFNNLNFTNSDFDINNNGSLSAAISNTWLYFNNEKNTNKTYKVTGQLRSHSSKTAPQGWNLTSTLNSPSDGLSFGISLGGNILLPWSDQTAVNFIGGLPQARTGVGTQSIGITISSVAQFTTSQVFTISWTILSE